MKLILPLTLFVLLGCRVIQVKTFPACDVVYSADTLGVFLYDVQKRTNDTLMLQQNHFLSGTLHVLNDTLVELGTWGAYLVESRPYEVYEKYFVTVKGDSFFMTDTPPYTLYTTHVYYHETYSTISLQSGDMWKSKAVNYYFESGDSVRMATRYIDKNDSSYHTDTFFICVHVTGIVHKGLKYCDFHAVSRSETVLGKQVLSSKGNLFLLENDSLKLLLSYAGRQSGDFEFGYHHPSLSPDGKKVVFELRPGYSQDTPGIYELDLETGKRKPLLKGNYSVPRYSPDGNHLLTGLTGTDRGDTSAVTQIYMLNIQSGKRQKIARGEDYVWIKRK